MSETFKVLSIDAWGNSRDGYEWNQWFNAGELELPSMDTLDRPRTVLREMRDQGFLSDYSKGRVYLNDDQYNIVVHNRNTHEPIFAIEYGNKI